MYSSSGDTQTGATLRKARLDSGLALEDVESETKIRKRYLEALEREDYGELPGAVYARGFLKTYANYLGLDGERLSRELKDRWDAAPEQERRSPALQEPRFRRRRSRGATGTLARRRIAPLTMFGFMLAFVLLVAAMGGLYWVGQSTRAVQEVADQRSGQSSRDGGQPTPSGGTAENGPFGAGEPDLRDETAPEAAPAGPAEAPPPPEVVRITVTVDQVPAWLSVRTDGNVAYEQVAQPGFSQTFEAGQRISVWTGNAGAVRLDVNGQDYGSLGAPGEVTRRTFILKPAQG